MSRQDPPYDGSAPCPFCPMPVRNLMAVAHNLSIGARDTTIDDLKAAVELCRPLADAHFADSMHSHGIVNRGDGTELLDDDGVWVDTGVPARRNGP